MTTFTINTLGKTKSTLCYLEGAFFTNESVKWFGSHIMSICILSYYRRARTASREESSII